MVSVHGSISVYIGFGQLDSILATIFRWLCIAALTTRIYILPLNRYYNGMVLSSLSLSLPLPLSLSLSGLSMTSQSLSSPCRKCGNPPLLATTSVNIRQENFDGPTCLMITRFSSLPSIEASKGFQIVHSPCVHVRGI